MAQNRKDDNTSSATADRPPVAPDGALTVVAPDVAPVAPSGAGADPDRVVAVLDVGGIPAAITARDAQRAVSGGMRAEMRGMVKAAKLAAALANGLTTIGEIEAAHGGAAVLDVRIECRRRGIMPLTGKARG